MSKCKTSTDFVRREARKHFERPDDLAWVKDVTSSFVIIDCEKSGTTYKSDYSANGSEITFTDPVEVDPGFVSKMRQSGAELTGPIAWKNEAKRLAFGAVLVPGEPDSDGDVLTAEKIADVAHDWLADYGNIDLQHSLNNAALPVESFLLPSAMAVKIGGQEVELPPGTWILGSRIVDDALWDKVVRGELSGYSIMGVRRASLKSKDVSLKRTMLRDLGPDWVAPFVSLVDSPAVPKAKFFAIKKKAAEPEAIEEKKPGLIGRLMQTIKSEEITMTPEEIKESVQAAVKEELDAREKAAAEKAKADQDAAEKSDDGQEEKDEESTEQPDEKDAQTDNGAELEALKAEVTQLKEKLATGTRALKSEDVETETPPASDPERDAFGRKIKK